MKRKDYDKLSKEEKQELYHLLLKGTKATSGYQNNKGWTDTPLFLAVEEAKQTTLF